MYLSANNYSFYQDSMQNTAYGTCTRILCLNTNQPKKSVHISINKLTVYIKSITWYTIYKYIYAQLTKVYTPITIKQA